MSFDKQFVLFLFNVVWSMSEQFSSFSDDPPKSFYKDWVVPLLVCLTVCVPLMSGLFQGNLLGQDERIGDRANSLWLHWYAANQWQWGEPFGQVDVFLHPTGVDLWSELFNVFDAFVAIPLVWMFGWGAHYNVLIVFLSVMAVVAGRLWASLWTDSTVVAWLSGLLFAGGTSLFYAVEVGRIVQVGIAVVPLGMWAVHRLRDQGSWQRGLLAGVTVGLAGTWYLYWGYGLVFWTLLWCPWRRAFKDPGWWVFAIVGALIAYLNLAHLDVGYLEQQVFSPSSMFPTLSEAFQPNHYDTAGAIIDGSLRVGWLGWSTSHSVSILLMLCAFFGFWSERRDEGRLVGVGLVVFAILGMGPYWFSDAGIPGAGQIVFQNPLYMLMYEYVPLIDRMHWLHRWLPFLAALLIPWATTGVHHIAIRFGKWIWLVPILLLGEWGYKDQMVISSTEPLQSNCYLDMSRGDTPIVLLPFSYSSRAAVFQPTHGHPIWNPISISYEESRWPQEYKESLNTPLLEWARSTDLPTSRISPPSTLRSSAEDVNVSHIVYHRRYLQAALYDPKAPIPIAVDDNTRIQSITEALGPPDCSDTEIVVWIVQAQ